MPNWNKVRITDTVLTVTIDPCLVMLPDPPARVHYDFNGKPQATDMPANGKHGILTLRFPYHALANGRTDFAQLESWWDDGDALELHDDSTSPSPTFAKYDGLLDWLDPRMFAPFKAGEADLLEVRYASGVVT